MLAVLLLRSCSCLGISWGTVCVALFAVIQVVVCSDVSGEYSGPGKKGPRLLGLTEFFKGFSDAGIVTEDSLTRITNLTVKIDSLFPESLYGLKLQLDNLESLTLTGKASEGADLSDVLYTVLRIYSGVGKIRTLTLDSITLSTLPDPRLVSAFSSLQVLVLNRIRYRRRMVVPSYQGPLNIFDWLGYSKATSITFSHCDIEIYNVSPVNIQNLKVSDHELLDLSFSGMNMHFVRSAIHYLKFKKCNLVLNDLVPTRVSDVALDGTHREIESLVLNFDNDAVELNLRSMSKLKAKLLVIRKVPKSAEKVLKKMLANILQHFERVIISEPHRSLITGYNFKDNNGVLWGSIEG